MPCLLSNISHGLLYLEMQCVTKVNQTKIKMRRINKKKTSIQESSVTTTHLHNCFHFLHIRGSQQHPPGAFTLKVFLSCHSCLRLICRSSFAFPCTKCFFLLCVSSPLFQRIIRKSKSYSINIAPVFSPFASLLLWESGGCACAESPLLIFLCISMFFFVWVSLCTRSISLK